MRLASKIILEYTNLFKMNTLSISMGEGPTKWLQIRWDTDL